MSTEQEGMEPSTFEPGGRAGKWVDTSVDITDHQRLEDELRASEERFRLTFEQAAVGIAHVGIDGRWLLVNPRLCDIVGYTQEELLGQTLHAVMLPEDLSVAFSDAQRLITGEQQTYAKELRFRQKDGSLVWVNLSVTLVRNQAQWPLYFLAFIEDDLEARRQLAHIDRVGADGAARHIAEARPVRFDDAEAGGAKAGVDAEDAHGSGL